MGQGLPPRLPVRPTVPRDDEDVLTPLETPPEPAPEGMDVGHVHLRVSDLEESVAFYRDVLGMQVNQFYGDPDDPRGAAAFLSFGDYHHHLGLNTWGSRGGDPPPRGSTGLFHVAFRVPTRRALARVLRRILDQGWPLDGASDHGVSEALYLSDPDGNGIEVYHDRPKSAWPRNPEGKMEMVTDRLDLEGLLGELEEDGREPEA